MPTSRILIAVAAIATLLASCSFIVETTDGSGVLSTERHDLDDFSRVTVHADIDVRLEFDDDVDDVEVRIDDNLHEHLSVTVDGDQLVIEPKSGRSIEPTGVVVVSIRPRPLRELRATSDARITGPELPAVDRLSLRASSDGEVDVDVVAEHLTVDVSSDGKVTAAGAAASATIDASSDGQAHLTSIRLTDAIVDASSDATVSLTATGSVTGEASSDARVIVGGGALVDVSTSSDGEVVRSEDAAPGRPSGPQRSTRQI